MQPCTQTCRILVRKCSKHFIISQDFWSFFQLRWRRNIRQRAINSWTGKVAGNHRKPLQCTPILKLHQLNFEGARTGSAMIGYKLAKLKFSTTHYHTTCWNHLNNVKQFWTMLEHIEPLLLTVFVVPVDPKDLCLGCDGHIITSIRFGDSKKVGTKKRPWRGHHYSMCRTAHAACVPMPHGDSKQFYDVHILACSSAVWGWFGHTQQHVNYSLAVKHYHRTDTMGEIKRLRPRWKKGYGRVNQRLVVADHHNNTANMWRALWKLYEHIVGDGSKIKWNIVQPRKDSLHKNMLNWSRRERVCMCM